MCGICGIVHFDNRRVVSQPILTAMRDSMIHRGPDGAGVLVDGSVGLGHRRLAVIDIEGGYQPMQHHALPISVVFNGEIYNFAEIRRSLEGKGHRFHTHGDTETILHLYERYGEECVKYMRGMFAFAIWDGRSKELFAARDRVGIKPFYYTTIDGSLLFASEIKAFLAYPGFLSEVDSNGLRDYCSYRFISGEHTLFQRVNKLLPGHILRYRNGKVETREYWDIPTSSKREGDLPSMINELDSLLQDSLRLRMISDVPLGVFLSGGVDSSGIVARMSSMGAPDIQTYTIGFEPDTSNELDMARATSKQFHTNHHEFILRESDFFNLFENLIWHHDEPLAYSASIPLYVLSAQSKKTATVMLAGEGADELFAGYSYNQLTLKQYELAQHTPRLIRRLLKVLPLPSRQWRRTVAKLNFTEREFILSGFQLNPMQDVRSFIRPDISFQVNSGTDYEDILIQKASAKYDDFLSRLLYFQFKTYLTALLMKQDKMTMAASIEARVPYLDHHLVEFSFGKVPSNFKLCNGVGKYILKKALEPVLPSTLLYSPKKGFPVPIDQWFARHDNPFLEILMDESTQREGFIRPDVIRHHINALKEGRRNAAQRLWLFVNLELWRRRFMLVKPSSLGS